MPVYEPVITDASAILLRQTILAKRPQCKASLPNRKGGSRRHRPYRGRVEAVSCLYRVFIEAEN